METQAHSFTCNTFLTRAEVISRYRWGRTKGYLVMSSATFPRPIAGDRYRLDALLRWEDAQMAAPAAPSTPTLSDATIPAPRRAGRRKAL